MGETSCQKTSKYWNLMTHINYCDISSHFYFGTYIYINIYICVYIKNFWGRILL